ncbi:hypothetical protein A3A20_00500 [Candidatus Wolfebacteria bacterium RIFCSPLOWO2_01_FULL_45_19]|uniref:SCP domain-containing protein n=1 Tax=Candidatus Wolfebacteria bacterium RIFCSPLOWO2_01_FULL_45_19 TaxID=1802557 RepID=A0A1F8DRK6_9BACT|nr:MAG: hypothetical protein A3A20_00500 [Candidatus Wolfebacteria bacterium RIFCSPLOWO2_01_FULL_45_19]
MEYVKNFFFPTDGNEMSPYGLSYRASALYFIFALSLTVVPVYMRVSELATLANSDLTSFTSRSVIDLANSARFAYGLAPLEENSKLASAAEQKIEDMFANQYFAHFSPQGKSPWDFFRASGYYYYAAGENLAIDFATAESAHVALMNSSAHRENILNTLYDEIGVAVKYGTFNGRPSIIVAQYFGKKRAVAAVQSEVPPVAESVEPAEPAEPEGILVSVTANNENRVAAAIDEPEVLPENVPVSSAESNGNGVLAVITADSSAKAAALFAMLLLLLSVLFLITRTGTMPFAIGARALVLLIMFAYVAFTGVGETRAAKVTPDSAFTVSNSVGN